MELSQSVMGTHTGSEKMSWLALTRSNKAMLCLLISTLCGVFSAVFFAFVISAGDFTV